MKWLMHGVRRIVTGAEVLGKWEIRIVSESWLVLDCLMGTYTIIGV